MVLLPSVGVILEIFLSTISINSSNTTHMVLLPSVGVVLETFLRTISINSSNTTVVSLSSKHWTYNSTTNQNVINTSRYIRK